ncbi:MAG: DUF45 domain-containing protein [Sedimentisphaerales bacterium]|nr:DUF45 domain-containing protein [Sedimentisphaerales bacterium]MBN2842692.1 DUF45 domain-containing protein [Sedimentisphaerales bacterium]
MSYSRDINIEGIGNVTLRKYRQSRCLRMTVKHCGSIMVSMPWRSPWQEAINFVNSKKDWIIDQQEKIARSRQQLVPQAVPARAEIEAAANTLACRLQELAREHKFQLGRISFRNQSSIWGSCSAANNISLNINLMFLPADLADYILLHELVHTRVKNHSKLFWHELDKCLGAAGAGKACQKRLRSYRVGPVAPAAG